MSDFLDSEIFPNKSNALIPNLTSDFVSGVTLHWSFLLVQCRFSWNTRCVQNSKAFYNPFPMSSWRNFPWFFVSKMAGKGLGLGFRILKNFRFFTFSCACRIQLPSSPPSLRRTQERFTSQNKTPRCHQYWLVGFSFPAWSTRWKVSELNDLGQNCYPWSGVKTFCILARLRRVLRTIFHLNHWRLIPFDLWINLKF